MCASSKRTDLVYSIDLVRGLDVYRVGLPGAPAPTRASADGGSEGSGGVVPMGMVGVAVLASLGAGPPPAYSLRGSPRQAQTRGTGPSRGSPSVPAGGPCTGEQVSGG